MTEPTSDELIVAIEETLKRAHFLIESEVRAIIARIRQQDAEIERLREAAWTVSDTETANEILRTLGFPVEPSLEPYADARRIKIAGIIAARETGLVNEIERLRNALQPFADLAGGYDENVTFAEQPLWDRDFMPTIADLYVARAILHEREQCARLVDVGFTRPGVMTKYDKCSHGRGAREDCEQCASDAIRRGERP